MVISLKPSHKRELWILCFVLFFEQINYCVHVLMMTLGLPNAFTTEILLLVEVFFLLQIIFKYKNRFLSAMFFPALVILLYLMCWVTLGENFHYVSDNISERLFLYCLPAYLCIYMLRDFMDLEKVLNYFCTFILISNMVAILVQHSTGGVIEGADYQSISYGLLIPFIFFVWKTDVKAIDIGKAALCLSMLVFFGGRSGILCAICCVGVKLLQKARKKRAWMVAIIVIASLVLISYKPIIEIIVTISSDMGAGGSLAKYSQLGDVFSDSGRMMIYRTAIEIIKDAPLVGHGMGADRFLLGEYGFKYGNYPHNLVLELMIHFGVVLGLVIIVGLFVLFYRFYKRRRENPELNVLFVICFFSTGFLILLFSSSYLVCPLAFSLLAIVFKTGFSVRFTLGRTR